VAQLRFFFFFFFLQVYSSPITYMWLWC